MKHLLFAFLFILSLTINAQTKISLSDVSKHIGDSVTLKAKIYGVKYLPNAKGAPTFISLGSAYPNQLLTIVIWQNVKEKLSFDPTEEKYVNGMAVATGKIELYNGKPQIVITNPKQLDILYDEEVKQSELPEVNQE